MQRVFIFLTILILAGTTLTAQPTLIRGSVLDVQQAGIPGADVIVKSENRVVAQAQTGVEGSFEVSLEPGLYTFEATADGFDKAAQEVDLTSDSVPLSLSLKTAQEPEKASVDAADSPRVAAESDQLSDEGQEVEEYLKDFAFGQKSFRNDDFVLDLLLADSYPAPPTSMRGTVLDGEQALVAGAEVVVKLGRHVVAQTQTSVDGAFAIPLESGQYTVEVTAAGFDKTAQVVKLTANSAPLSFTLKVPHRH